MRVRAERDQAFAVRVRELFTDMRLLWPALGATMAVLVCLSVAIGVLKSTSSERPESLATMTRGDESRVRSAIRCGPTTTRASIATSTSSSTATELAGFRYRA